MSLIRRKINVTFQLGEGQFGESGFNTVKVNGLRTTCRISNPGGQTMGSLAMVINGMTLSTMNKLSTLGIVAHLYKQNLVTVEAGDDIDGMAVVFKGTISNAYIEFGGMPEVGFHVEATSNLIGAIKPAEDSKFDGEVDIATVLEGLAKKMGLEFENNGVSAKFRDRYYKGSLQDQARAAAHDANVKISFDNGKLAIWPKDGSRTSAGPAPLISAQTGMISYPVYTPHGIQVRSLFNRNVEQGKKIVIESQLNQKNEPSADTSKDTAKKQIADTVNGEWIVYALSYALDAETPRGRWSMTIDAARQGFTPLR